MVEPLPYSASSASLIGICASDRNVSFGNYPTTSSAERRLRRHRPEPGNRGRGCRGWSGLRAIRNRRAGLAARAVAVRRRQISGRFQTLRLRQSGRHQGRRRAADPDWNVRQFQSRGCRRQRFARLRCRADLRVTDDAVAGRSLDGIRRTGRVGQSSGGFFFGYLPPAGAGEMARRQAGDSGGCDFLARGIQETSSAIFRLLPSCGEGGEDR